MTGRDPSEQSALSFRDTRKRFGNVTAVDSISLDIADGSFVTLVGASGSGKSTLLKTINRLVEPDEGAVLLEGEDVRTAFAPDLRRRIGYVFQGIGLFPHMSVAENIAIGPKLAGIRLSGDRIAELLEGVELDGSYASRMPHELSGGQRQRIGVARALAADPHVLLMDEPFGALDPVTRDALGKRVRALHLRLGLTTVMVTHDMAEALLLADRVLVMDAGRIVADKRPQELLAGEGGTVAQELVAGAARAGPGAGGYAAMTAIVEALLNLGDKLAAHVLLAASALALGVAVALPLAVWASRSPPVARVVLGFASLVQTIPALALLALFFPILLSLRAVFGEGLPTLGFLPALLALALYALLPILRNSVTAREHMAPGVLEAADGGRHDGHAKITPGRGTARRAVYHGRYPHRRGVDHRCGDAFDDHRPAEPGRSDLRRTADAKLGAGTGGLHRLGPDWRSPPMRCSVRSSAVSRTASAG